jgi:thioredoxin 1
MANVTTLDDANFDREILAADEPAALVDFTANRCPPCRAIAPTVEALATEYRGRVKVGAIDVDAHNATAQRFGVRAIPTLLVFRRGQVVAQLVGAVSRAKIEAALKNAL